MSFLRTLNLGSVEFNMFVQKKREKEKEERDCFVLLVVFIPLIRKSIISSKKTLEKSLGAGVVTSWAIEF